MRQLEREGEGERERVREERGGEGERGENKSKCDIEQHNNTYSQSDFLLSIIFLVTLCIVTVQVGRHYISDN